ncbi:hypothetical protein CALVIDRAFT_510589 [Calocera viscosa TUFC12733]|uniref:Auxin efflux carrier n=1 Tax=Calocera viscosa (strain TUFC12733) TaxID=1330018 RepID=A0A167QEV1_CALVF|nr:hypothetical protein CALVIDRAFT_510589 [Calocera viscosa TUFC12733]
MSVACETPALGALIWIATKPLIRLVASVSFGYILAKLDLLGSIAARGVGQIILNITLPSLLFSKLVPAFTSQNIVALGPLVFIALLYQALGFVFAWFIRLFFYVPARFQRGVLLAGGWNNWGDVPVAVLMSITSQAPFTPSTDEALAIAYLAPFILVYFVTLFPMGGFRILLKDFKDPLMEDEGDTGFRARLRDEMDFFRNFFRRLPFLSRKPVGPPEDESEGSEKNGATETAHEPTPEEELHPHPERYLPERETEPHRRHVTFLPDESTAAPTHAGPFSQNDTTLTGLEEGGPRLRPATPPIVIGTGIRNGSITSRILPFLRSLLEPICLTMICAIIIALVPTLKALFTPVDGVSMPNAPDGLPPLSFVLDIATFFGNASVPCGLLCLGSAFARMHLPRPIWKAPLGSIISMAVAKMAILPILAVLIVQALTFHTGMLDPNDKVLRFVAIFLSAVPTATTQVYLTQVHSPDGDCPDLPAYLILQYIFMFGSMPILTAYVLHQLF